LNIEIDEEERILEEGVERKKDPLVSVNNLISDLDSEKNEKRSGMMKTNTYGVRVTRAD